MAKPIEPTPVLSGEDAKRLLNEVSKPIIMSTKKLADLKRCADLFKRFFPKQTTS